MTHTLTAVWARLGVTLMVAFPVFRLGSRGLETLQRGISAPQWALLAALTIVFLYFEGYRGFQLRFVPMVNRRIRGLRNRRGTLTRLAAPLYAMALIRAPRRLLLRTWIGAAAIVAAVFIVRAMPEPWRGIVDVAVAAALSWGTAALLFSRRERRA